MPAVTLAELADYLKIEEDDPTLAGVLAAAVATFERETQTRVMSTDETLTLDGFPVCGVIRLPFPPLQSVASVKYDDPDGVEQTLASSAYRVLLSPSPGRLAIKPTSSWPATLATPGCVRVAYVAGHANAVGVPADIKQAITWLAAHYFETRVSVDEKRAAVPMGVRWIIENRMFRDAHAA